MPTRSTSSSENISKPEHHEQLPGKQFWTGLLVMLPLFLLGWLFSAITFVCFWNWFLVPLGIKSLPFWNGFGLWLFFSFLKQGNSEHVEEPKDYRYWRKYLKNQYSTLGLFFVLAWLTHLLIK